MIKKNRILLYVFIAIIAAAIVLSSCGKPPKKELDNNSAEAAVTEVKKPEAEAPRTEPEKAEDKEHKEEQKEEKEQKEQIKEEAHQQESEHSAAKEEVRTAAAPAGNKDENSEKQLTCFLSVRCDTLLSNMDKIKPEKAALVPPDGVIFSEREVVFFENESVFNVLKREMRNSKIHMEFENAPIYGSAYIEGIGNLYEFDGGELSGWMYRVNGIYPNYGCSKYILKPGDKIEWIYTCDLGRDIGGGEVPKNGKETDE